MSINVYFFSETCKILGLRKVHTTNYHPMSNGTLEHWHRSVHTGLSHYINATHTNLNVLMPFYLMAHRATPSSITGFSPFYLLHGREMPLPNSDNLYASVTRKPRSSSEIAKPKSQPKHSL